jgi:putative protease
MFELSTHIPTLRTLKETDLSAYHTLYLGDPTCPQVPGNLSSHPDLLKEALYLAKEQEKGCYLSLYAEPRNKDLLWIERLLEHASSLPLNGIEVHNLGLVRLVKKMSLPFPVHLGIFANLYTHETAKLLHRMGVTRVFPNPELSLEEINYIRTHAPTQVTLQIHGKIPLGISENCFILEYRQGTCEELCFKPYWLTSGKWTLKNLGRATVSGKDLCLMEYLGSLYWRGFRTLYIQTLRESKRYIETIGTIYRRALEKIAQGIDDYIDQSSIGLMSELSPYGFCNGYLFRKSGHRYIGRLFGGEKISPLEIRKEEWSHGE